MVILQVSINKILWSFER